MPSSFARVVVASSFLYVSLAAAAATAVAQSTLFPPPPTPSGNPVTAAKARLGQALFWDEQLSATRTTACGTCHIFSHGGNDPRSVTAVNPGPDGLYGTADDAHTSPGVPNNLASGAYAPSAPFGVRPQLTRRRAPTVVNAAWQQFLFWDGRAESATFRDPVTNQLLLADNAQLENLVAMPPVDTVEMGHVGRTWTDVVARVQSSQPLALATNVPPALATFVNGSSYPQLFQQAFGTPVVDAGRIVMAMATYLRTLASDQTRFDLVMAGTANFTPQELAGFSVFGRQCSTCHAELLNSSGPPVTDDFRNTGVAPIARDRGRGAISGQTADDGKFRVPQLRNVALRPPFFHDGSAATLAAVADFYGRGGDFHVNQDPLVQAIAMTAQEKADLVAFLQTLTDPRVQNEQPPFDRPRLYTEGTRVPVVFGTGTGGTSPPPRTVAVEPPVVGNPRFTVGVDRAQPNAAYFLGWDVTAHVPGQLFLGLRVHLALTPSFALVAPGTTQGSGPGGGAGSFTFAIPAVAALRGATIHGQWLVADPAGPSGFTTSDGFSITAF